MLWCIDEIPVPPHCPFDSIVINCLPDCSINWTATDDIEDYKKLIEIAKIKAGEKSLSELELAIWNSYRPSQTDRKINLSIHAGGKAGEGYRGTASKYHNQIVDAMTALKGEKLNTGEIVKKIIDRYPELKQNKDWIYPSDHCINHTNDGACYCAESDTAIFEKVKHGTYRIRQSSHKL